MRRLIALLGAGALAIGCASPGLPPGGPPDAAAPKLIRTTPDSGSVNVTAKSLVFVFDETVNERPAGQVADLAGLFLISPRSGSPDVSWRRGSIEVRPTRGWKKNTTYSVTLLRGLADLRGNVRDSSATVVFSTGPTIPATRISGMIFDWVAGTPASNAMVEAFTSADTLTAYTTVADSAGVFTLRALPPGVYTLRGFIDQNRNRGLDPREAWDSVTVALRDTARRELLAVSRDTTAPSIGSVTTSDSVTVRVTLDNVVAADAPLSPALFTIVAPDSSRVPVLRVSRAPADSGKAGLPRPSRPAPIRELVLQLSRPLRPRLEYRIGTPGLRGILGRSAPSERTFFLAATTPQPPARTAAPSDSVARTPPPRRVPPARGTRP